MTYLRLISVRRRWPGNCDCDTFAGYDRQFNQPVKIKSISFFSGISPPQGPKTVQLFINQPQFDFADADSHEPTQELVLTEGDVKGGNRIDLRFVRFQNVNSLHVSFSRFRDLFLLCSLREGTWGQCNRSDLELIWVLVSVGRCSGGRSSSRTTRGTRRPPGSTRLTCTEAVGAMGPHPTL